ncbi:hypothetical protein GCM10007874_50190 [Labrys miyagiensis]|uniref:Uncharacterized protein n=1 Tax=Labrys miyagiensis TaxID=346912 RepID=A0ABQ6CUS2_9HYPH|nr:hypothetical protein GCM10007874_50190 [Labrys miyagiensis]
MSIDAMLPFTSRTRQANEDREGDAPNGSDVWRIALTQTHHPRLSDATTQDRRSSD